MSSASINFYVLSQSKLSQLHLSMPVLSLSSLSSTLSSLYNFLTTFLSNLKPIVVLYVWRTPSTYWYQVVKHSLSWLLLYYYVLVTSGWPAYFWCPAGVTLNSRLDSTQPFAIVALCISLMLGGSWGVPCTPAQCTPQVIVPLGQYTQQWLL